VHGGLTANAIPKALPIELLVRVLDKIPKELSFQSVLLAGYDELFAAEYIRRKCTNSLLVLTPPSPRVMAAVLSHAAACFGGDSGPLHIAAAVGTPVVCCFGPSSYERAHPVGNGSPVIALRPPCLCGGSPLERNGTPCLIEKACLRSIKPDEVINALRQGIKAAQANGDEIQ